MNKILLRFVSFLLVSCVIADPVAASSQGLAVSIHSDVNAASSILFDVEALSVRSGWVGPLFSRKMSSRIERLVSSDRFANIQRGQEIVDVVDDYNRVIGQMGLQDAHKSGAQHRGVTILFVDRESGDFILQKRAPNKATFPGRFDVSVAGHVKSGATYEETAEAELLEESPIPIDPSRLIPVEVEGGIFRADIQDPAIGHNRELKKVYIVMLDGNEVEQIRARNAELAQFWEGSVISGPGEFTPEQKEAIHKKARELDPDYDTLEGAAKEKVWYAAMAYFEVAGFTAMSLEEALKMNRAQFADGFYSLFMPGNPMTAVYSQAIRRTIARNTKIDRSSDIALLGSDVLRGLFQLDLYQLFGETMIDAIPRVLAQMGHPSSIQLEDYSGQEFAGWVNEALKRYRELPGAKELNKPIDSKNILIITALAAGVRPEKPLHTLVYVGKRDIVIHEAFLSWLWNYTGSPEKFITYLADVLGHENAVRTVPGYKILTHEEAQRLFPLSKALAEDMLRGLGKDHAAAAAASASGHRAGTSSLGAGAAAAPVKTPVKPHAGPSVKMINEPQYDPAAAPGTLSFRSREDLLALLPDLSVFPPESKFSVAAEIESVDLPGPPSVELKLYLSYNGPDRNLEPYVFRVPLIVYHDRPGDAFLEAGDPGETWKKMNSKIGKISAAASSEWLSQRLHPWLRSHGFRRVIVSQVIQVSRGFFEHPSVNYKPVPDIPGALGFDLGTTSNEELAAAAPGKPADFGMAQEHIGVVSEEEHAEFHEQGQYVKIIVDIARQIGAARRPDGWFDLRGAVFKAGGHILIKSGSLRLERDGLLVIIDRRFGKMGHAGPDEWAAYAVDEPAAQHEMAELRALPRVAIELGAARQSFLPRFGSLATALRKWMNDGSIGGTARFQRQLRLDSRLAELHEQGVAAENHFRSFARIKRLEYIYKQGIWKGTKRFRELANPPADVSSRLAIGQTGDILAGNAGLASYSVIVWDKTTKRAAFISTNNSRYPEFAQSNIENAVSQLGIDPSNKAYIKSNLVGMIFRSPADFVEGISSLAVQENLRKALEWMGIPELATDVHPVWESTAGMRFLPREGLLMAVASSRHEILRYLPLSERPVLAPVKERPVKADFIIASNEDLNKPASDRDVGRYIADINSSLQAVMAQPTDKRNVAYPSECPLTCRIGKHLLEEKFPGLRVDAVRGERFGAGHAWLEILIGDKTYFASWTEGQFFFQKDPELMKWHETDFEKFTEIYQKRGYARAVFQEISGPDFYERHKLKKTQSTLGKRSIVAALVEQVKEHQQAMDPAINEETVTLDYFETLEGMSHRGRPPVKWKTREMGLATVSGIFWEKEAGLMRRFEKRAGLSEELLEELWENILSAFQHVWKLTSAVHRKVAPYFLGSSVEILRQIFNDDRFIRYIEKYKDFNHTERRVIRFLARGWSEERIAQELGFERKSIKWQITLIRRKFGLPLAGHLLIPRVIIAIYQRGLAPALPNGLVDAIREVVSVLPQIEQLALRAAIQTPSDEAIKQATHRKKDAVHIYKSHIADVLSFLLSARFPNYEFSFWLAVAVLCAREPREQSPEIERYAVAPDPFVAFLEDWQRNFRYFRRVLEADLNNEEQPEKIRLYITKAYGVLLRLEYKPGVQHKFLGLFVRLCNAVAGTHRLKPKQMYASLKKTHNIVQQIRRRLLLRKNKVPLESAA